MKPGVTSVAVVLLLSSGLSAHSTQQGYPPDTQAQSSPSPDESEPRQNSNPEQQTEPSQAQPPSTQPQEPESQQAEPQQAPPQTPPQRAQPQPRATQRQSQAPRPRTQQQASGLDIQGVTPGEVTVGGGTIGKLRQDWQSAWNSRRLDDLMGLYSDDAVLLLPGGQRIMGKQAIRDYFQQVLMRGKNQIVLNSLSTYPADRLAYDDGTFRETIEPITSDTETAGDAARHQVRGNYLTVIGRSGDGWLIREQALYGLK